MSLTFRQKQFVERYLVLGNATQAAKEAGYSARTARQMGSENLTKPVIQEEIRRRVAELVMGADEALQRLAQIARGEHGAYIQDDGTLDLAQMKEDGKLHLVKSIRPGRYGLSVEFGDMLAALVTIARRHGLLRDRVAVEGTVTITPEIVAEADRLLREFHQQMDERADAAYRRDG